MGRLTDEMENVRSGATNIEMGNMMSGDVMMSVTTSMTTIVTRNVTTIEWKNGIVQILEKEMIRTKREETKMNFPFLIVHNSFVLF